MQTKQQKLNQLNKTIIERTEYLRSVEIQIEEVSNNGNNRLFDIQGQIDRAEIELASVMKRMFEIEQIIREKQNIADSL